MKNILKVTSMYNNENKDYYLNLKNINLIYKTMTTKEGNFIQEEAITIWTQGEPMPFYVFPTDNVNIDVLLEEILTKWNEALS